MGHVRVRGFIGRKRSRMEEVEFLVDTGAFYTVLTPSLAKRLGLEAQEVSELTLADKRVVQAGVTVAYMRLLDREGVLPIAIMETPEPLLGVTALEGLGLKVDPTTGELQHSRPYGLAAI
ncbi:MAG: aspartyl protease family protein [Candidatus Bathyarchaeia archaeon]